MLSLSIIDPRQLKRIRTQVGITQSSLAKAAGLSQSLIAKIEAGSVDPTFGTVRAISDALRSHMNANNKKAGEVLSSPVVSVQANTRLSECVNVMKKNGISQLPIFSGEKPVGSISENHIVSILSDSNDPKELLGKEVRNFMLPSFPIVSKDVPIEALFSLFRFMPAVLVSSGDKIQGIITKIDLLAAEAY